MRWFVLATLLAGSSGCDKLLSLNEVPLRDAASDGRPPSAIKYIQSNSAANQAYTTTLAVTLDAPAAVGDLLVVAVASYHSTLKTVSDTAGNTYYPTPIYPATSQGGGQIWIELAEVTATATSFTVTATTMADTAAPDPEISVAVHEYAGLAAGHVAHRYAMDMGGQQPSCGTFTIGPTDELVVAAMTHDMTATSVAGAGFVLRENSTDAVDTQTPLVTEDAVIGPGRDVTPTFAISPNSSFGCATITLL